LYDIELYNPSVNDWDSLSDAESDKWLFDENTTMKLFNEQEEKTGNSIKLNLDARLCVVYNFNRWYLRVYGHYNQFRYGSDLVSGRLTDWTAYASLGFRF